ncbi:MAG: BlaI/MecI/CopY family transcriptional regulator [Myxococcota bacterium]
MGSGLQLSDQQLAFMRALWDLGEATSAEVHAALVEQGQTLAPTTVATTLTRLEKRGLVGHRSRGRQYIYRALVGEHEARQSMLARLTGFFFGGDTAALVTHLTDAGLGEADLDEVKKMINERERESKEDDHG